MLFDSISFALFLPLVFLIHWAFCRNRVQQNLLLLTASYIFYGFWDWRFLFILIFSILINFIVGANLSESKKSRKVILYTAVIINIGVLGFFKYYNVFIESFNELLLGVGITQSLSTLQIILPVGISFYTFHGLSYILDIYNGKIKPTKSLLDYSLFVSYFPLLVAGPIERASHLLPQLKEKRNFNYLQASEGLKQMLWGFFKKIAIADNCAGLVNNIFSNYEEHNSATLLLGAFYFTIQIYCDFSGYSDIALGTSKLFGINLLKNFNYPLFSRDIAEFWRRWHISLSSWFKDYLYIPLGGSRGNLAKQIRNTFIIFIVSGFWHGSNWTYIVWGGLNALYIMPSIIRKTNRTMLDTVAQNSKLPTIVESLQMTSTFLLTALALVVFRAKDLTEAVDYISRIFTQNPLSIPTLVYIPLIIYIIFMLVMEWQARLKNFALDGFAPSWPRPARWAFYIILILIIMGLFPEQSQQFIYFQF